mmetsp:Transcript_19721/g.49540  ORF Transcript_19721/g.49540 Transcript_19721/m.49540 type:complete len:248 (+) Transcript_19721:3948-4691(+)
MRLSSMPWSSSALSIKSSSSVILRPLSASTSCRRSVNSSMRRSRASSPRAVSSACLSASRTFRSASRTVFSASRLSRSASRRICRALRSFCSDLAWFCASSSLTLSRSFQYSMAVTSFVPLPAPPKLSSCTSSFCWSVLILLSATSRSVASLCCSASSPLVSRNCSRQSRSSSWSASFLRSIKASAFCAFCKFSSISCAYLFSERWLSCSCLTVFRLSSFRLSRDCCVRIFSFVAWLAVSLYLSTSL